MTIDRVIKDLKGEYSSPYNNQLVEWLEELKAYRTNEGMSENVYRCGYKFGYNKAIDDCIEELKKRRDTLYMKVNCDDLELKMLSEKLKGAKQNE
jgi:hypothetical protein